MAKAVRVFVCDENGNGLSGQKVKYYGLKTPVLTSSEKKDKGIATLLIEGDGETDIYVNGTEIWTGFKSALPSELIYKKS